MDGMKGDLASSGFTFLTVVVAEDHGRMSGLEQRPAQTQRRSLHYKVMDVQRLSAVLPLPSAPVQPRFSRMFPVVKQQVLHNSQETRMCHVCSVLQLRVCSNIPEHFHLLWEVIAEQAVEATQVRLSGEAQPHHLAQVPDQSVTSTHINEKRKKSQQICWTWNTLVLKLHLVNDSLVLKIINNSF